jgi:hypothetical protein
MFNGFKFGMDVIPLETTLYSYFQFSTISNANLAGERTYEMEVMLPTLNIGSYNDLW